MESRTGGKPFREHELVPKLIAVQASLTPDGVALTAGAVTLSYHELDARARALSDVLRALGVGPDVVVGLCLPRSLAMVVGALGILKAEGAYLPLDPTHPPARLASILHDAGVSLVVTASGVNHQLQTNPAVILNDAGRILHSPTPSRPAPKATQLSPKNLAYVIYTSGSTGQPKGVEIMHESLSNLVSWHGHAFHVTPADRASHIAPVAFDAAVWEIWPYLASGASVHLPDAETARDAESLQDWLEKEKITISFIPTPLAEYLLKLPWPPTTSLRTVLTGADILHSYPPSGLPFSVVNNYGPTECTVVATSGPVNSRNGTHRLPPIGSAISNTQVYIFDESGNEVPPGTSGELHIGGVGLARGYRGRPKLTARNFVPHPRKPGERLFKTGDRGRLLPDGQIAFLGRMDEQVKVRGFRVEPNEVAATLNRHPDVQRSVVVNREVTPGDVRLIAYFVAAPNCQPRLRELRDFLTARLPDYMVPAIFVQLEKLLLTPNGKIDRKSLPAPDESNILCERAPTAPRTEMETVVANILAHLLKLECVDAEENFFSLGGHSLLGAQLVARLRDAFGIEVPLRMVFETPTVASLSGEIERLCLAKIESERPSILESAACLSSVSQQ
jgi:amino acid adenylation domain-containing protein